MKNLIEPKIIYANVFNFNAELNSLLEIKKPTTKQIAKIAELQTSINYEKSAILKISDNKFLEKCFNVKNIHISLIEQNSNDKNFFTGKMFISLSENLEFIFVPENKQKNKIAQISLIECDFTFNLSFYTEITENDKIAKKYNKPHIDIKTTNIIPDFFMKKTTYDLFNTSHEMIMNEIKIKYPEMIKTKKTEIPQSLS